MKIKQYDWVRLKTGQLATIVEVLDKKEFLADIGSGPEDWDTVRVSKGEIKKVYGPEYKTVKTA